MTDREKWQRMQNEIDAKDAEIARLNERLELASKRMQALTAGRPTGIAAVDRDLDRMRFKPGTGTARMAAGMKLPRV